MKYYIMIIGTLFFYSCTKELMPDPSEIGQQDHPKLKMAGDGQWDVLGFGYDLMGAYLSPTSVKDAVIDLNRFANDYPGRLYYNASTSGYNKFVYGANAEEYLQGLTNEFDSQSGGGTSFLGLKFSATISKNQYMNKKSSYSLMYSFANCDVVKNVKRIYLSADLDLLKNYVNPAFLEDVNTLSAAAIIERYGTHVLTDFTIGGRLNLIYKSVINSTTDSAQKKLIVKAGLNASLIVMNINHDANVTTQEMEAHKNKNEKRELYIEYYGGEGTGLSYNLETGYPTLNVSQWESSVNVNNAALTRIDWSKAYPIFEFVADPIKRATLRDAIIAYVGENQLEFLNLVALYWYPSSQAYVIGGPGVFKGYLLKEPEEGWVPLGRYYSSAYSTPTGLTLDPNRAWDILGYVRTDNTNPDTREFTLTYFVAGGPDGSVTCYFYD